MGKGKNGLHFKEKQVQPRIRFPQPIENRSSSQINLITRDYPKKRYSRLLRRLRAAIPTLTNLFYYKRR